MARRLTQVPDQLVEPGEDPLALDHARPRDSARAMEHPQVARAIAARKLDNVAETGAAVLVTDNPGCLLHLRGAADVRGMSLRVVSAAEILAERLAWTLSGNGIHVPPDLRRPRPAT